MKNSQTKKACLSEKIVSLSRMADILNITPTRMKQFAERGDVPYEVVNNEMFFDVEQVKAVFK